MRDEQLEALARVALANDLEPIQWEDAPEWRRSAMIAVARAAVGASGLSRADHAFSAWLLSMTVSGWKWGRDFDERECTHPGIVMFRGGLPRGDSTHWTRLVDAVRARAKEIGLWVTE